MTEERTLGISLEELAKTEGVDGEKARAVLASLELKKKLDELQAGECKCHMTPEESMRIGMQIYKSL